MFNFIREKVKIKAKRELGMVAHMYNPCTWEARAGRLKDGG
jgi:hypothetical protein